MALIDARTARILTTLLAFALGLAFLYVARHTLIAFLFAIFFAYLVDPGVSRIQVWVRSRGVAIAVIYCLLVVLLVALFSFVGPNIARQAQHLGEQLPPLLEKVGSGQIAVTIGQRRGWSGTTIREARDLLAAHRGDLIAIAQRAGIWAAGLAQETWLLFIVPVLAAFFLKDGNAFSEAALSFVHAKPRREFLEGVRADLNQMLAQFIRAQLTLAACSLVTYMVFMGLILRMPYALVLGTAGGLMEFIPVVGPLVTAIVIIGVALLMSYPHWLVLLIFLGIWRLLVDYVVAPRIMGKSMQLHPLAAIFGVLAGGEIAGVLGVYLSIPIMASLRIVWRRWSLYAEKRRFGPLNEDVLDAEIRQRQ